MIKREAVYVISNKLRYANIRKVLTDGKKKLGWKLEAFEERIIFVAMRNRVERARTGRKCDKCTGEE